MAKKSNTCYFNYLFTKNIDDFWCLKNQQQIDFIVYLIACFTILVKALSFSMI